MGPFSAEPAQSAWRTSAAGVDAAIVAFWALRGEDQHTLRHCAPCALHHATLTVSLADVLLRHCWLPINFHAVEATVSFRVYRHAIGLECFCRGRIADRVVEFSQVRHVTVSNLSKHRRLSKLGTRSNNKNILYLLSMSFFFVLLWFFVWTFVGNVFPVWT